MKEHLSISIKNSSQSAHFSAVLCIKKSKKRFFVMLLLKNEWLPSENLLHTRSSGFRLNFQGAVKFMEFLCFSKHDFAIHPQDHKKRGFTRSLQRFHLKANSTRWNSTKNFPSQRRKKTDDHSAMCFCAFCGMKDFLAEEIMMKLQNIAFKKCFPCI